MLFHVCELLHSLVQILVLRKAAILDCFQFSGNKHRIHFCSSIRISYQRTLVVRPLPRITQLRVTTAWRSPENKCSGIRLGQNPATMLNSSPSPSPCPPLQVGKGHTLGNCSLKQDDGITDAYKVNKMMLMTKPS